MKTIKGNKKTIEQLIKDYSKDMYRLIFLHTKYEEDSKTILKDTIDFIEQNISKLDKSEDIVLWIYKIIIINTNNFLESIGMVEDDKDIQKYCISKRVYAICSRYRK